MASLITLAYSAPRRPWRPGIVARQKMEVVKVVRSMSRRLFLRGLVSGGSAPVAAPLLAACGGSGSAAATQSTAAATATTSVAPTTSAAAGIGTTVAAAAKAGPGSGDFNVWFSANWNEITNKAVGDVFVEWGKQRGLKTEYQVL